MGDTIEDPVGSEVGSEIPSEARGTVITTPGTHYPIGTIIPIPRNVWQVMPVWHLRVGYIVGSVYIAILFTVTTIAAVVRAKESNQLYNNCTPNVRRFLFGFGVLGYITFFLLAFWSFAFVKWWLPHYLKTAKPIANKAVLYSLVCGTAVVATFAFGMFGLYAARFDDLPGTQRCGFPARATQGISGSFMAGTVAFIAAYVIHYRVMKHRLDHKVRLAIQRTAAANMPMPGDHLDY